MLKFKTSCAVLANLSSNLLNEVGLSLFRNFEVGLRVCDIVVNKYVRYLISWWVLVRDCSRTWEVCHMKLYYWDWDCGRWRRGEIVAKMIKGFTDVPWQTFFSRNEAHSTRGHSWKLAKQTCNQDCRLHFLYECWIAGTVWHRSSLTLSLSTVLSLVWRSCENER